MNINLPKSAHQKFRCVKCNVVVHFLLFWFVRMCVEWKKKCTIDMNRFEKIEKMQCYCCGGFNKIHSTMWNCGIFQWIRAFRKSDKVARTNWMMWWLFFILTVSVRNRQWSVMWQLMVQLPVCHHRWRLFLFSFGWSTATHPNGLTMFGVIDPFHTFVFCEHRNPPRIEFFGYEYFKIARRLLYYLQVRITISQAYARTHPPRMVNDHISWISGI